MEPRAPGLVRPTRRGFLRLLGGGAALAALARIPVVPAAARADAPPAAVAAGAGRFFDPGQTEVLTCVVERMVADGPEPPAVRGSGAVATIDRLCAGLDPALTGPLPALLWAVEWGPPLFDLRLARFTSLDAAGRDAHLRGWMTSRLALRRQAFQALKNLAMLGWYSQEESWPAIGYAGPLLRRDAGGPGA